MNFIIKIDATWLHPGMEEWSATLTRLQEHQQTNIQASATTLIQQWTQSGALKSKSDSETDPLPNTNTSMKPPMKSDNSQENTLPQSGLISKDGHTQTSTDVKDGLSLNMIPTTVETPISPLPTDAHTQQNPEAQEDSIRHRVEQIDQKELPSVDGTMTQEGRQCPGLLSSTVTSLTDERHSESRILGRRVEGLLAPLPRPFRSPSAQPVTQVTSKRRKRSTKRVSWAPDDVLVTVRYFKEADPPMQWLTSSHIMRPVVGWTFPKRIRLEADWQVQRGENSQEKQKQIERENRVAAVCSASLAGDFDPEEPYPIDVIPDPMYKSINIPLKRIKKQPTLTATTASIPPPVRASQMPVTQVQSVNKGVTAGSVVGSGGLPAVVVPPMMMQPTVYFNGSVFQSGYGYIQPQPVYFVPEGYGGSNVATHSQYLNSDNQRSG